MSFLHRQASDLVVYLLLPFFSLLLPARASRALVVRASRWRWLLATQCREARSRAQREGTVDDPDAWARRWRLVELLEARDLFCLAFGRARSVLREIEALEALDAARGCVFVGMHWGPSISVLRLLAQAGMQPAFIYRPVERSVLFARPFHYLFLRLSVREIRRACAGRELAVGGARERLRQELAGPGSEVVLMDAPPPAGRSERRHEVLGRSARFSGGFPALLVESRKPFVFYAVGLHPSVDGRKRLELSAAQTAADVDRFLADYAGWLTRHLREDSAQWRLWPAAAQFFPSPGPRSADENGEASRPGISADEASARRSAAAG